MKRLQLRWIFGIVYGLSLFCFSAFAQDQAVEADGVARILDNNTAMARDNAIVDAQRKAVEQAVGVLMSSESVVQNYEIVSDRILTQSAGYITSYDVLDEQHDDKSYRVKIRAVIGMGALENDVQAIQHLIQQKGNPRMMFLVSEELVGLKTAGVASADMAQAEVTLQQAFVNKGFDVVDAATVAQNVNREQALKAAEGDAAAAAAICQQFGADVVITVKSSASAGAKILNSDMKSYQAVVTAKAVRADTAAVIASASEQAKQAHIDDLTGGTAAIQKASVKLADALIPKILEQWRQDVQTATTVQLVVSNISFAQLKQIKEILSTKIRGVKAVNQRSFQQKTAVLDVDIQGTTETLADELTAQDFNGVMLDVTGMTGNKIELAVP
ncbi:hypothetical protein U14_03129 [Candidatus Moduliflexus flocculans]|uniref:Flagellar assembly protein T N-terminal domain-containing protein n=1 Tax=Candidatus Moduliflexus flocculans TaxID=1499966 RepID=A0A081BNB7_9BACT|nr:hypothetical protein U14_03129 [Candidatus Moduliflexus flocculans]